MISAKLWRGPENIKDPWVYVEFPPDQEVTLPSDFDSAIQTVDKSGTIVAGKCPQLVKKGRKYKIHPALDADLATKRAAFERAQRALADKAVAEQAAILAAGELAMQENVERVERSLEDFKAADRAAEKKPKQ